MSFLTAEDAKIALNLFCCIYGIGTLGMPGSFARAGPYLATLALLFMGVANTYAAIACSKLMLLAPNHVKTYGDLGEYCLGKPGRYISAVAQLANCLLIPCSFLVLGGTLLSDLFPNAYPRSVWILFMALSVVPFILTPTLKEGAFAALAGCAGTIFADAIGLGILVHGMEGHPSVPPPELSVGQVAGAFGNLSLAFGFAFIIPELQSQHSNPERMPRVIFATLVLVTVLFFILASVAYSSIGCQVASNLLFSIYADPITGLNSFGFAPHQGAIVTAFLGMQLHITIAFGVNLYPALYLLERVVLGMHRNHMDQGTYTEQLTPQHRMENAVTSIESRCSVPVLAQEKQQHDAYMEDLAEYSQGNMTIKYCGLRLIVLTALLLIAIAFQKHFREFTDLIGASSMTLSCLVLPIFFYLKLQWQELPMYEKIPAVLMIVLCSVLGIYVTYATGVELFAPEDEPTYRYCPAEFEDRVYYNRTALDMQYIY